MHCTSSTNVRVYKKQLKILCGGNSTIKNWRKNQKDIQSCSMTVEAGVSLETCRTLKKPKLAVLEEAL
jgi:hypothetical protein